MNQDPHHHFLLSRRTMSPNHAFSPELTRCGFVQDREDSFCCNNGEHKRNPFPVLDETDFVWEDDELPCLKSKEETKKTQLYEIIKTDSYLGLARHESVDWMLKVVDFYSFSAQTAILAVDYLDRFMLSFHLQMEKPWMSQLVAVTCLSLAAKVEETQVPLLLDLQIEESKFVFEPKTIQRMEVLVLSTLEWRMNPVTPLSFLDYIARRLGLKDHICWEFLRRSELILLSTISDSRFMCYLPSEMATATLLHVVDSVSPSLGVEYQTQLLGILGINKEKISHCSKMITELSSSRGHYGTHLNKRKFGSTPRSPNGVMDVSFSSDTSNDSWPIASSSSPSVSSSPEPLSKKKRGQQDQIMLQRLNHEATTSSDVLSIPP